MTIPPITVGTTTLHTTTIFDPTVHTVVYFWIIFPIACCKVCNITAKGLYPSGSWSIISSIQRGIITWKVIKIFIYGIPKEIMFPHITIVERVLRKLPGYHSHLQTPSGILRVLSSNSRNSKETPSALAAGWLTEY